MSLLTQVILASALALAASQCPSEFFEAGTNCYAVIDEPGSNITWSECRTLCQGLAFDAWSVDLATFDNAEQLEAFSIAWLTETANYDPYPYMWIGVSKVDGAWQSLDGTPLSLQSNMWGQGHPHEMGMTAFLDDVTMANDEESYGRQYFHCSMGMYEYHRRCLCRAQ
ncbi:C-type lectin domain family 4 member D [Procambarus clarkii]|uniref:C-type lectin domain family 4 member D n=1 Tax=Procambarus clarkii TaxID=6728 RepID=UPI001E675CE3|nr:C-type lectin domain family 4 member D-like [Procambarus clarkii]